MNNVNLVGRLTRTPELREVNRATSCLLYTSPSPRD